MRKRGLEPLCLSAPPPQDGVSANFTTSAVSTRKYIKSWIAKGMREKAPDRGFRGREVYGLSDFAIGASALQRSKTGSARRFIQRARIC